MTLIVKDLKRCEVPGKKLACSGICCGERNDGASNKRFDCYPSAVNLQELIRLRHFSWTLTPPTSRSATRPFRLPGRPASPFRRTLFGGLFFSTRNLLRRFCCNSSCRKDFLCNNLQQVSAAAQDEISTEKFSPSHFCVLFQRKVKLITLPAEKSLTGNSAMCNPNPVSQVCVSWVVRQLSALQ